MMIGNTKFRMLEFVCCTEPEKCEILQTKREGVYCFNLLRWLTVAVTVYNEDHQKIDLSDGGIRALLVGGLTSNG